jgi:hypothetical protein
MKDRLFQKITEDNLPVALTLYITRDDIEYHDWDEIGTWRFISGIDKRHPYRSASCTFVEAVAAFLMGEIAGYYGEWIDHIIEEVPNYNNGKVLKVENSQIQHRNVCPLSRAELDILVVNGFKPIGYTPDNTTKPLF